MKVKREYRSVSIKLYPVYNFSILLRTKVQILTVPALSTFLFIHLSVPYIIFPKISEQHDQLRRIWQIGFGITWKIFRKDIYLVSVVLLQIPIQQCCRCGQSYEKYQT